MPEGLLSLSNITPYQFSDLLDLAHDIKSKPGRYAGYLAHKTVGEIIVPERALPAEPSFHAAVAGLGGTFIPCAFQSPPPDVFFTLRHLEMGKDLLITRAFSYLELKECRNQLNIPILNHGSDTFNPCRVLSDLFTLKELSLDLNSLHIAYIGGRTPVLHSLIHGLSKTGSSLHIACPKSMLPEAHILNEAVFEGKQTGFSLKMEQSPEKAVKNADVLYTDCGWQHAVSKNEAEKFRITPELIETAGKNGLVFHGHSLYAGKEVETGILTGPHSAVLKQWENTLHIQKAIMVLLLKIKK
jgi:ornithine carbamoyltransferase